MPVLIIMENDFVWIRILFFEFFRMYFSSFYYELFGRVCMLPVSLIDVLNPYSANLVALRKNFLVNLNFIIMKVFFLNVNSYRCGHFKKRNKNECSYDSSKCIFKRFSNLLVVSYHHILVI